LRTLPTDQPVYFGSQYQYPTQGRADVVYASGGAGYGLNRAALGILLASRCNASVNGLEDATIGT